MMKGIRYGDCIEKIVLKRKFPDIPLQKINFLSADFIPGYLKAFGIDIKPGGRIERTERFEQIGQKIALACSYIE
jgi:hypothetical protein